MTAAAPWSVKGIEPKAREIAKDLARRSGMTLGEWLNTMIMDDDDDGVTPLPRRAHAAESIDRRGRMRRMDDAYDAGSEREASGARQPGQGRATDRQTYSDFGRDPGRDEVLHRVAASVDAIAARLEASERRSTLAIQGVDQAVSGLLRRIDGQDEQSAVDGRRIDDIVEELREGTRRLRAFEKEVGPRTAEAFAKTETSIAAVTSRLYDIEERQRLAGLELRQRVEATEAVTEQAAQVVRSAEAINQVAARLDHAQAATTEALRGLERSFAGLDHRLRTTETQGAVETGRFEKLAETLTQKVEDGRKEIMRQVGEGRDAVLRQVDQKLADQPRGPDAEAEARLARIEKAVAAIDARAETVEKRSAEAVDTMGREIVRIAQNLNGRIGSVERVSASFDAEAIGRTLTADITARVDHNMGRFAQVIEQRLNRSDDQHAMALEKLGGEITRISDRLTDRIVQSERRSAQAVEDIARRLDESAERSDQRFDRASGELTERMRLSEERTVRLLNEARDRLAEREAAAPAVAPVVAAAVAAPVVEAEPNFPASIDGDWRAAAFPSDDFTSQDDGWNQAPLPEPTLEALLPEPEAEAVVAPTAEAEPAGAETKVETPALADVVVPQMQTSEPRTATPVFGKAHVAASFGGADVSDALEPALLDDLDDDFEGDTDFVNERAMRAQMASAAAAGRAANTRSTIDAARAAMNTPVVAPPAPKAGFNLGFKRGGKSKLQERLDKQATRDGSTVRKALLASVIGAAAVGGVYSTMRLTGMEFGNESEATEPTAMAAMALSPTLGAAAAVTGPETIALYEQGLAQLDGGDASGLAPLTEAANLGYAPAQLKLVGLYQTGDAGVPQDETESRLWARRAAEGGDPRGMHAYGMYLYDGVGGGRSRTEALTWLTRAADRGLVDSQFNAAKIFETGDDGIPADPGQALKWYMIAARSGDAQAEAAVARLSPTVPAADRTTARAAATAFSAEAIG